MVTARLSFALTFLCCSYVVFNSVEESHSADVAVLKGCQPQCCPKGFPSNTPFECQRPTYSNKTGIDCPDCPTREYHTCKPTICPFPPPPVCPPPPPNMTTIDAYCVADGGIFCPLCKLHVETCSKGLYFFGKCRDV